MARFLEEKPQPTRYIDWLSFGQNLTNEEIIASCNQFAGCKKAGRDELVSSGSTIVHISKTWKILGP